MTLLQRLLLLPLLSPLLALLLLGAVNPRPWVALRLLTWVSPAWPLGVWISAAAAAGAGLSAAGTALALQGSAEPLTPRRQVRRRAEDDDAPDWSAGTRRPAPEPKATSTWSGPSRAAGEPAPTVSVPFRVIRRGQGAAAADRAADRANASAASRPAPMPSPGASAGADDDWMQPSSDDW